MRRRDNGFACNALNAIADWWAKKLCNNLKHRLVGIMRAASAIWRYAAHTKRFKRFATPVSIANFAGANNARFPPCRRSGLSGRNSARSPRQNTIYTE